MRKGQALFSGTTRQALQAFLLAAAISLSVPSGGLAQSTQALEAQRQTVFAQLLSDPVNRALMAEYVRLSVELRDFESVAATLERLVALEPANLDARLDLAQAYSAIGAHELANVQIAAVLAAGPSAGQTARAETLQTAAGRQSNDTRFSGAVTVGIQGSDIPEDRGLTASLALTARIDMGGPNAHDWLTEFGMSGFSSFDGAFANDTGFLRLRTGPEFRITGESFGPRLQPYLQLSATRDSSDTDLDEAVLGFALQLPFNERWTSFADLSYGRARVPETDERHDVLDLSLGTTYRPGPNTALRVALIYTADIGALEDSAATMAQLGISRSFDNPLPGVGRDWRLGAHVVGDITEVTGGRDPRTEEGISYGLSLRGYMSDQTFFELGATRSWRRASLAGFDTESTLASFQIGWEF